ncbi:hypothetical protein CC86DRAFT_371811 [Ophiobolus disseminans]|uniref:MARVEL domain-containing protein n=1 Tax=Ophiobolus disseminans TaxID=1469910 RepID=A0A6A6ZVJ9_9PLEO|nr:hypothetical protein CC86DRAFT_371811 [Ophiobolus disseminans]
MGIFTPFTSPHDIRWQGPQRHHHALFLVKNFILFLFIILVIVEYPLFKNWWENGPYQSYKSWEYAPYHFWLRIGLALIPDVLVTLTSLVLILNPLHHSTYSFHPIFALVSSIFLLSLYVNVCWLNPLIAYSNEVSFHNHQIWNKIVFAETAFEVVLCLCWIAMMGFSCVAVHKWRMAKKAEKRAVGDLQG